MFRNILSLTAALTLTGCAENPEGVSDSVIGENVGNDSALIVWMTEMSTGHWDEQTEQVVVDGEDIVIEGAFYEAIRDGEMEAISGQTTEEREVTPGNWQMYSEFTDDFGISYVGSAEIDENADKAIVTLAADIRGMWVCIAQTASGAEYDTVIEDQNGEILLNGTDYATMNGNLFVSDVYGPIGVLTSNDEAWFRFTSDIGTDFHVRCNKS